MNDTFEFEQLLEDCFVNNILVDKDLLSYF